jgi:hypothetical protein
MKIPLIDYLRQHKIDSDRIAGRFVQILAMLNQFRKAHNITDDIAVINRSILLRAVVDYFVDLVRVKEFHKIKHTNKEKIYSYMAYWLLKRKPLQALKHFKGCEYINELFITDYLISSVSNARGITLEEKNKNPSFRTFEIMLYYNLCFRIVTQQSLELMIDAFFGGYDFPKG